jgi:hypothetical protein
MAEKPSAFIYMCVYIYTYMCVCIYIYIYVVGVRRSFLVGETAGD